MKDIKLFGVSISPYVHKTMVALYEKEIEYDHIELLPKSLLIATEQAVPVELDFASPQGKIPVLQIDGRYLSDSAIINIYLDKFFSGKKMIYSLDPKLYTKQRWFEMYSDSILSGVISIKFL